MVMERDLTQGGEHTIHCTDDVLQNRVPETYVILLTKVTPINSLKKENELYQEGKQIKVTYNSACDKHCGKFWCVAENNLILTYIDKRFLKSGENFHI